MSVSSAPPSAPAGMHTPDFSLRIPQVHIPPRVHEQEHMALWQVRGSCVLKCGAVQLEIRVGEAVFLPAGTWHEVQVHPNSVLFPFWFPRDETATTLDEITRMRVREEEKIYFLTLYQSQSTIIRPPANLRRQVLTILERRALTPSEPPSPTSPAAGAVAEALLFNPGDTRTIQCWAQEVHLSSRSLERAFRNETGLTFQQWRAHARMRTAARLLRSGASVTSVTHRVGYESATSFARAFRTFHGMSPTEYMAARH